VGNKSVDELRMNEQLRKEGLRGDEKRSKQSIVPPLTRKFMRWKIFCVVHPSSGTRRWILMS